MDTVRMQKGGVWQDLRRIRTNVWLALFGLVAGVTTLALGLHYERNLLAAIAFVPLTVSLLYLNSILSMRVYRRRGRNVRSQVFRFY